jgi:hypothetical protein
LLSCACAWLAARSQRAWIALFAAASCAGAIAVLGVGTIRRLGHSAPEGATRFSSGAHWLLHQRGLPYAAAACAIAVVAATGAWRAMRRHPLAVAELHPRRTALLQVAFLTAVPLFLLKDSYDYRFVLWLPCLALPIALLRHHDLDPAWRRCSLALLVLAVLVFCAELPCMLLDRLVSHDTVWPQRFIESLVIAKQFSAWLLAGLLTALFAASITERLPPPAGLLAR